MGARKRLLGWEGYGRNGRLGGGRKIRLRNGGSRRGADADGAGVEHLLRWLSFVPGRRGAPCSSGHEPRTIAASSASVAGRSDSAGLTRTASTCPSRARASCTPSSVRSSTLSVAERSAARTASSLAPSARTEP